MKTKIRFRVKIVLIVAFCFLTCQHVSASDRRKRDQWASFFKDLEKDPFKSIEAFGNKDGVDVPDGTPQVADAKSPIKTTITVEAPASGSEEDNQPHVVNNIDSGGDDVSIDSLLSEMGMLLNGVKGVNSLDTNVMSMMPTTLKTTAKPSLKKNETDEEEGHEPEGKKSDEETNGEHVVVKIMEPKSDEKAHSDEYEDSNSNERTTTVRSMTPTKTLTIVLSDGGPMSKHLSNGFPLKDSSNNDKPDPMFKFPNQAEPKSSNGKPSGLSITQPKTFSIGATIANPFAGSYIHTHGPMHGRGSSQGHSHGPSHKDHVHGQSHHETIKNGLSQFSKMQMTPNNSTTPSPKNIQSTTSRKPGNSTSTKITTTEKPTTTSKRPVIPTTEKSAKLNPKLTSTTVPQVSTTTQLPGPSTTEDEGEYYDSEEETTTAPSTTSSKYFTTKVPPDISTTESEYESGSAEDDTQTTTTLSPLDAVSMTNVDNYVAKYFSSSKNSKTTQKPGDKISHSHGNDNQNDKSHNQHYTKSHFHGDKNEAPGKFYFANRKMIYATTPKSGLDPRSKFSTKFEESKPASSSASFSFPAINSFLKPSSSLSTISNNGGTPTITLKQTVITGTTESPITSTTIAAVNNTETLPPNDSSEELEEPTTTPGTITTTPTTPLSTTTGHTTTSGTTTRKSSTTTTHRTTKPTEDPHSETTTVKPTEAGNHTHENKSAPTFISADEFFKLFTQSYESGNKTNSTNDPLKMFAFPMMSRSLWATPPSNKTEQNQPGTPNEDEDMQFEDNPVEEDTTGGKHMKGKHKFKKGKKGLKKKHGKLSNSKGSKTSTKKSHEKNPSKKKTLYSGKNRNAHKSPGKYKFKNKSDKQKKSKIDDEDNPDEDTDKENGKQPDFLGTFEKNMKRSKSGTQKTLTEIGVPGMAKYQTVEAKKGGGPKGQTKKQQTLILTTRNAPKEETTAEKKRKQVFATSMEKITTQRPKKFVKPREKVYSD